MRRSTLSFDRRSILFAGALAVSPVAALGACDSDEDPCANPKPGILCTVVGTGVAGLTADGLPALETELYLPQDTGVGPDGLLYVVDWNNHRIRVVKDGMVDTLVGTGYLGDAQNGKALTVNLNHPTHITFLNDGDLIISAWHNSKVLRYDKDTDEVTSICGTGARNFNGDGKPALETFLDLPTATGLLPDGRLLISDQANQRIRIIEADGTVGTVAGTGEKGYSGDGGPALEAKLQLPTSQSAPPAGRITVSPIGEIFLADTLNHVVRKIDTAGIITTVAGIGSAGNGTSAVGKECALNMPSDLALDNDGNLYIADTSNSCIRKLTPAGAISTAAGQCGKRGFEGDGGKPEEALLDRPYGVDIGPDGTMYVSDTHNHVIRAVKAAKN
ncbi:MAG: hypothetical protein JNJ59_10790 [Deltaproteobacteria bacterium]|nr:hypothetical protein [Deltaproteobacteria bacterium]